MRHIEFCLQEIECEIDANETLIDSHVRGALEVHIAGIRTILDERRAILLSSVTSVAVVAVDDVLVLVSEPVQPLASCAEAPTDVKAICAAVVPAETPVTATGEFEASAEAALAAANLLASPPAPETLVVHLPATTEAVAAPVEPVVMVITPPVPAQPRIRPPLAAKPKVFPKVEEVASPAAAVDKPTVSQVPSAEVVPFVAASRPRRSLGIAMRRIAAALALITVCGVLGASRIPELKAAGWQSMAQVQAGLEFQWALAEQSVSRLRAAL